MVLPIVMMAISVGVANFGLPAIGYGAGGIVAGSYAASMMSAAAIANGGGVASMAAGGVVATCQSIGALGLGAKGLATAAAVGYGAGAVIDRAADD